MTSNGAHRSSDSDSSGEIIYTPSETDSRISAPYLTPASRRRLSPSPLRVSSFPSDLPEFSAPARTIREDRQKGEEVEGLSDSEVELSEMESSRPPMHRPTGGLSQMPLLREDKRDDDRGRTASPNAQGSQRPTFVARRSTFRSRSPSYVQPEDQTRRKYIYASFFLVLSLVSFVVQTETAVYIQHSLGWKKAYCMLWLTHGSWSVLWPVQLLILRIQKRKIDWAPFWRRHKYLIRTTAQMVQSRKLHLDAEDLSRSPVPYMLKTTAFVTTFLTVAGGSWYVAVDLTSPSDLTAIYNCSAFFAYVFSILLLNDKFRADKMLSVGLAIVGVLVVAYGDKEEPNTPGHSGGSTGRPPGEGNTVFPTRLLGNLIIGFGSVLYGLYEVLYKKHACPPEGTSPGRGMIFANAFGSMIGMFTLCVLWIPLPILHFTGIETFELPTGKTAAVLAVSTLSNATFSGSFLVLMSLTSPVLSSVAALLTIFLVAVVDWMITSKPLSGAAVAGGLLIIVAFVMLSWATYREMVEGEKKREKAGDAVFDDDEEEEGGESGGLMAGRGAIDGEGDEDK